MIKLDVYPRVDELTPQGRLYTKAVLSEAINNFNEKISVIGLSAVELHDDDIELGTDHAKVVGTITSIELGEDGKYYSMFNPLDKLREIFEMTDEEIANTFALSTKSVGCVDENGVVDIHRLVGYTLRLKCELLTKAEKRVELIKGFL